jgi:SsrA-binding protein
MPGEKLICSNKKARYDYHIDETFEAGMVLLGTEAKSLRTGRANLKDSYARINDGEIYLVNCHISAYEKAGQANHDPERDRKLLMHKREIKRLTGKTVEKGLTLVPLRMYFKNGVAKVELALARGKKSYDKRETMKQRTADREMQRAIRDYK